MTDTHRLVFIGGLHRSGTTPLTNALRSHPEASGITESGVSENEGVHLQDVYPRIREFGGMGRFAFDPRAHLTEESPLASPASAQRLFDAWSPYWDLSRPVLVEKSPANLIMGRFLQATFPSSSLVVILRHPVVTALALEKWTPRLISRNGRRHTSLPDLVGHWVRAHQLLLEDAPRLERLHVLRYEDLIADPEGQLAQVSGFLGLNEDIPASSIRGGASRQYAERWEALRTGGMLERRRHDAIVSRYADDVAAFGYSLDHLDDVAAWPGIGV